MLDIFKTNTNVIENYNFIQKFLVSLPRLFLEIITIFSIVIVSLLFIYSNRPMENFIPFVALLAVAGVRLIPSFNLISQSIAVIKFNSPSYDLIINELKLSSKDINLKNESNKISFEKSVELKRISYKYPQAKNYVLENINLKILTNQIIGLSGASEKVKVHC